MKLLSQLDSGQLAFNLMTMRQWEFVAEKFDLTARQVDVCERLLQCLTREQIARQLGIKDRTVRSYMEQIHVKLNVKNRVGIVLRIIEARDSLDSADSCDEIRDPVA